jgi:hypothetical protein
LIRAWIDSELAPALSENRPVEPEPAFAVKSDEGFSVGDIMKSRNPIQKISILAGTLATALVLSTGAIAQHGGGGGGHGGGGGGHGFGGGGHATGAHAFGGGYRGGYGGYHGGYGGYGGWRGGYGWHGGYGWRGGYYGGWGCCGWGYGWGLGLGLYFATLPLYYDTYYWDGIPYYYANNTYYLYDPNVKQYETVAPPAGLQAQAGGPTGGTELMAYPKNGQTTDQQARDKFECHQWAATQSGFDPTAGSAAPPEKRNDYMRAQAACLEGRGYSVQ